MVFSNAEKMGEKGKTCQSHDHHVLAGQSPFTHPDGDQTSLNQQFNICTLSRITRTSQSRDSFFSLGVTLLEKVYLILFSNL